MKIYLVGGAVRDKLRNIKPSDKDYVVVGSDSAEMQRLGFFPVGKGFPVFLHPETKDEYALARKEIKTGNKHGDFSFIFGPDITLREDLERRDFTCNAIAYDPEKNIYIDYFNGQKDIQDRIIRHINATHFVEDPLRILRMCRFAAQLDFSVAPETFDLCKKMVKDNLLSFLSAERIGEEFVKAMKTALFHRFINLLFESGAFQNLFSFINPDIVCQNRLIAILQIAENEEPLVKFALMCHFLKTPEILKICKTLKVPNKYRIFALAATTYVQQFEQISSQNPECLFELIGKLTIGHISYVAPFIAFCRAAVDNGKTQQTDFENKAHILNLAQNILSGIKAQDIPDFQNLPKDNSFGKRLRDYKISVLNAKLCDYMEKLSPK